MRVAFVLLSLIFLVNSSSLEVRHTFTIWFGDDKHTTIVIFLRTEPGRRFMDVMKHAADEHPLFKFRTHKFNEDEFVTSIGDEAQDPESDVFWLLYVMPSQPSEDSIPDEKFLTTDGVNVLKVQHGNHYLFWLRTISRE